MPLGLVSLCLVFKNASMSNKQSRNTQNIFSAKSERLKTLDQLECHTSIYLPDLNSPLHNVNVAQLTKLLSVQIVQNRDAKAHLISSGNWALVTRKLEMCCWCRSRRKVLISGYMMGSPTRDRAQCFMVRPSSKRSGRTPGTPVM